MDKEKMIKAAKSGLLAEILKTEQELEKIKSHRDFIEFDGSSEFTKFKEDLRVWKGEKELHPSYMKNKKITIEHREKGRIWLQHYVVPIPVFNLEPGEYIARSQSWEYPALVIVFKDEQEEIKIELKFLNEGVC